MKRDNPLQVFYLLNDSQVNYVSIEPLLSNVYTRIRFSGAEAVLLAEKSLHAYWNLACGLQCVVIHAKKRYTPIIFLY